MLPKVEFIASPNYQTGRGGKAINKIIIHTNEGTLASTISWLTSKKSDASYHYIFNMDGSRLIQFVREEDTAYHCGNWEYNLASIGVSHEGFAAQGNFNDKMYMASAELVASLCKQYKIPIDRYHILAHAEVPNQNHTDPGQLWDWDRYLAYVKNLYIPDSKSFDVPGYGTFSVSGYFYQVWLDNQWLGLPLSPEKVAADYPQVEQFAGTVQWFERGRLEWHDQESMVMFGRVGAEAFVK